MDGSREPLLRLGRRTIALLVVLGAVQAAALASFVLLFRHAIDAIGAPIPHLPTTTLLAIIAVSGLLACLHGIEFRLTESVGYDLVQRIRIALYEHLTELPPRSVQRSSRGALLLRFSGDLSTVRTWTSRGLGRGIVSGVVVAGVLAVTLFLNLRIGLVAIGVVLLGAGASTFWGDRVRRTVRATRWRRSLLMSNIAEQIGSLASVQFFGRTGGERSRLAKQNDDLTGALHRMVRTRARLRAISSGTASAAMVAALAMGSREVVQGRATVGTVVAAIAALRFASGPMRTLGQSYEYWQAARVSKRKLREFFARPGQTDAPGATALVVRAGEIVVRGLTVRGALDGVDLATPGGQMLAIIGPNGAGKSTLLDAIARLVVPNAGEVLIDGEPIVDRRRRSVSRHIGMVSPNLPLLRGTLGRNLLYRFPEADDDEVQRVIAACRLDEVTGDRPDPLSMWLSEGGMNISPGHRQRIALARAVIGNPRILLLDEPTANLDEASKEVIRRLFTRYRGTVVLVTHDAEEAALADRVCRLEAGRLVESMSGEEFRERRRVARRVVAGRPQW